MSPRVTAQHLTRLREKYAILTVLRESRERAITEGCTEFPEDERPLRRATMKALAAEFPGALRELDELRAIELRARLAALEAGERQPWMEAAVLFHWSLREALSHRRGHLPGASFWSPGELASVIAPPTGRLLDVVWSAVARELNMTAREAERLVYPRAPERGVRITTGC